MRPPPAGAPTATPRQSRPERVAARLATIALALGLLACSGGDGTEPPADTPPVRLLAFGGQSNAGAGGRGTTMESQARFPNVRQFAGAGKAGLGSEPQAAAALGPLVPAFDAADGGGQWPQTMAGFAIAATQPGVELVLRTDWYGGQAISAFLPGTTHFANSLQAFAAARAQVERGGRRLEGSWYVWIQDEAGASTLDGYREALRGYVLALRAAAAAALGPPQPFTFVMLQPNSWDSPSVYGFDVAFPDAVAQAQWELSRSMAGVLLAGPLYQVPLIATGDDGIHATALGRMMIGDLLAAVWAHGPGFRPLQPRSASLDGRVVELRFDRPAGALAWDEAWVAPAPKRGFAFRDDAGSASIESVEIVSPDTVRLVLSAPPTGANPRVLYAHGTADELLDGWAAGRGQLMSPSSQASYFHRLGHAVPAQVNHYAVRFAVPVPWDAGR